MKRATPMQIVGNRALFLSLSMLGILFLLLPISMLPKGIIWPEITFLAAMALVIRNPKYVPFWLLGFVFLASDFLLAQPLGLGAFIAVLACEYLRRNRSAFWKCCFLANGSVSPSSCLSRVFYGVYCWRSHWRKPCRGGRLGCN